MLGIPSHLLTSLREALADCEPFESNRSLRNLFANERLLPWRNSLPEGDGINERVDNVISYLHDKKHRDGSNALVSLLLVLSVTIPDDGRREGLRSLADQLSQPVPGTVHTGAPQTPAAVVQPARPAETKPQTAPEGKRDFFISYNRHDKDWAEWIAWQLENAGHTLFLQAWDFLAGGNFVSDMHNAAKNAERTIAVLSETYLSSEFAESEWNAAFVRDPTGKKGLLLPVKVRECDPQGLLSSIVYIDLTGLSADQAAEKLLAGVKRLRAKPSTAPGFPGTVAPTEPPFPATT